MTNHERVEAIKAEIQAICQRYKVDIWACGCCDSINIDDAIEPAMPNRERWQAKCLDSGLSFHYHGPDAGDEEHRTNDAA